MFLRKTLNVTTILRTDRGLESVFKRIYLYDDGVSRYKTITFTASHHRVKRCATSFQRPDHVIKLCFLSVPFNVYKMIHVGHILSKFYYLSFKVYVLYISITILKDIHQKQKNEKHFNTNTFLFETRECNFNFFNLSPPYKKN